MQDFELTFRVRDIFSMACNHQSY